MLRTLRPLSQLIKMLVQVLLLLICSVFTGTHVFAQEPQPPERLKHGLGYSGGYILGNGLTYVRYLGPHMLQGSFIGDVDEEKTDLKAGLSYARYVHQVQEPRSLVPVALKFITGVDVHYQDGVVDTDVIVYDDSPDQQEGKAYFFHTGAGLGMDIGNPGKPGLVLSLVLTYTLSLEQVNKAWEWDVSPLPAVGILYSW